MKIRNIILILSTIALVALPACHKKEESTEVTPYLDGSLTFDMPPYVLQGESFHLIPSGASNPSGKGIGYAWSCSWITGRDTVKRENGTGDGSWNITVPDKVGSYNVTVMAFATDFNPLSSVHSFSVVDPSVNGSFKGAGYQVDSANFVDPRDGGIYYLATIGDKIWMQNNLYYSNSGVPYEYSPAMDKIAGRLYNWNEAMEACPEGWHLPSDAEFTSLALTSGDLMADVTLNDSKMWTFWPDVKISNKVKFSAAPFGYAVDQEGVQKYAGTNSYAAFWTSDSDGDAGLYKYIYVSKTSIFSAYGDKVSFRASVRCVKDKE